MNTEKDGLLKCSFLAVRYTANLHFNAGVKWEDFCQTAAFPLPAYQRSLLTGVMHAVFTLHARNRTLSQSVRLIGAAVDTHKLFFPPLFFPPRREEDEETCTGLFPQ